MEELDLKIIRDRNEFRKFLEILVFADEYDLLHAKLSSLLEGVQAKTFYRGGDEGGKEDEDVDESGGGGWIDVPDDAVRNAAREARSSME